MTAVTHPRTPATTDPASPPPMPGGTWAPVQLLVGAVGWVVVQILAALIVAPLLVARHGGGTAIDLIGHLVTDPFVSAAFFTGYAALAVTGFFWLTRAFAPADHATTFGRPGILREVAMGALVGGGLMVVGVGVLALVGAYRGTDPHLHPGLLAGIAMGLGAACGEEALFRGVLFRLANARLGSTWAVVIVGTVFGFAHAGNPGAGAVGGLAILVSAGLLLTSTYLLTDRLWLPLGIHWAWNAVQSGVFGITVSGTDTGRGLWRGELVGPDWLSGGTMGIEGSVVQIVLGLAAGIVATVLAVRAGRWRPYRRARAEVAGSRLARRAALSR